MPDRDRLTAIEDMQRQLSQQMVEIASRFTEALVKLDEIYVIKKRQSIAPEPVEQKPDPKP